MNAQFCWGFGLEHRKEENWIENHTISMVSESPNEGRNLKTEKSQDYAQKPQRNSTVMNSTSGQLDYYCASRSSSVRQGQTYIFLALCVRGCIPSVYLIWTLIVEDFTEPVVSDEEVLDVSVDSRQFLTAIHAPAAGQPKTKYKETVSWDFNKVLWVWKDRSLYALMYCTHLYNVHSVYYKGYGTLLQRGKQNLIFYKRENTFV